MVAHHSMTTKQSTMKYLKRILLIGSLSALLGCNDRQSLGGNYLYDKSGNKILYRYSIGGAVVPSYQIVPTKHPKTFKVLSQSYAVDKTHVFWAGKLVENAVSEGFEIVEDYPSTFGKNRISQQMVYQDAVVNMDFSSIKIHSQKYLSDKNKVLYIASKGREKYGLFHTVAVSDPANFQLVSAKNKSGVLSHDAKSIYLKPLNTHIPPENAQVIQYHFPIILQNDVLHYFYPSYREVKQFKVLPPNFVAKDQGIIGTFGDDTYYHFSVSGFDQARQLAESDWINDNNGLYFINDRRIHKIADKPLTDYTYDDKYPNFIRSAEQLLEVVTYPFKVNTYPSNAVIFDDDIVRVGDTVYKNGEALSKVDVTTFAPLKSSGYVDKDFYYYGHRSWTKRPIPHWAYQALLNGKNPNDFFGIEMQTHYTVYKTYWNGFLVSLSVPSKNNPSSEVLLDFKNIERKTLQLSQPIEQQLHISYTPHNTLSPVYYRDNNAMLVANTNYDFQNIKADESIQFSFTLNQQMLEQYTVIANSGQAVPPRLVLCSKAFALEREVMNLYLEASIER